jgi:NAD(P)-dependent dehydrogenase (short-subunit alcohol dehydrogenase family)
MRLDGEVAIVTGSTRGIGRAIATRFAEEGASVVVTGRAEDLGREVEKQIRDRGGRATFRRADLKHEGDVQQLIDEAVEQFDRLTILVNNAAPTDLLPVADGAVVDIAADDWQSVVDLTLRPAFYTSKHALPKMIDNQYGSIVNISSGVTIRPMPGQAAYTSAKAGVEALTRTLAVHYGQAGVRANTIVVGFVPHDGLLEMLAVPQFAEPMKQMHLTRLGNPDDVAHAAVYLASHESDFVTGTSIVVDGGATCRMPTPELSLDLLSDETKDELLNRG